MDPTTKELLHNGIAVAILVPVMSFILWGGTLLLKNLLKNIDEFFKSLLEQQKEVTTALKELARSFTGIQYNCQACRVDSLTSLREAEASLTKKFVEITAAMHDKTFAEMYKGFNELGAKFEKALTGTAESIRAGNEDLVMKIENQRLRDEVDDLSRPHDITVGATPQPIGRR
jgi:hypothetical protein